MIRVCELSKHYADGTAALRDVDLVIDQGEMVFLRGPSGAGKTTLFEMILGIEPPSSGAVEVAGQRVFPGVHPRWVREIRRRTGVIFQDFRLFEGRTVRENVELGLRVLGIAGQKMRTRTDHRLENVGLLDRAEAPVGSLSWGERQRVGVARALAREPDIILADEPTGNLDEEMSERVLDLLYEANQGGATVVVAIHAPHVLKSTRRRVVTLRDGRVADDSAARDGKGS